MSASTDGKKPSDYPIGSLQSRAAARAMIAQRFDARKKMTIVFRDESGLSVQEPYIGEWQEGMEGKLIRRCFLPDGMTLQDAESIYCQLAWAAKMPPEQIVNHQSLPDFEESPLA